MAAKKRIFVSRKIIMWPKFGKTTFPMEFFNEIWLKEGEHEYIYIFEIKFEKYYSVQKWRPKQVLWHYAIMLIYAK